VRASATDAKPKKPIAYYWARVGTCSNPSCRAEVPLLKGFYLVNKPDKKVYLKPITDGNKIDFEIKKGKFEAEGWMNRGNMICPCCGNPTDVNTLKQQFKNGETSEKMLAVIWDGQKGKEYRKPSDEDLAVLAQIPADVERPSEAMPVKYTQAMPCCTWGLKLWSDMFFPRQLLAMQTLVQKLNEIKQEIGIESEYGKAIATYLAILVDRVVMVNTSFGRWNVTGEKIEHPFSKQAIPMMFDYPESNLFCDSTGSASNQLQWLKRYIESESSVSFSTILQNASSGGKEQFPKKSITAVVTDPPYCLTAGTLILTENGYRPIEEIKVGEQVLSHEGRFVRVTRTFERDYDGDLWRVYVTGANRPLEITPEHPIYAMKTADCPFLFRYCRPTCSYLAQQGNCRHQQFENYKAEWICPTDLKAFDLIGFPILQTKTRPKDLHLSDFLNNDKYTLSAHVLHYEKVSPTTLAVRERLAEVSDVRGSLANLARQLDVPKHIVYRLSKAAPMKYTQNDLVTVNADFMRLLGYFVADGYANVKPDGGSIYFTFGLRETAYGEEVERLMRDVFGIRAGKTTDNRKQNNNSLRWNFYSKPIAEFLRRLCYAEDGKKILPAWVLTLPENLLWNFVETLWNGDGHRSKESYSLANVSPYLIGQTQIILHRLGLLTGYYHDQKERVSVLNGNTVFGRQKFSLNVNGESLCRMAKKIGLPASNDISRQFTGQRGYSDGKMVWRPIRKIEKTEFRGKVYNLETEDHSYTTFAGCVHNCDAIAYADLSDFFYVWLKRTLGDVYPANFATPQTPKTEECTALKHHHDGDVKKANEHFENKLLEIFDAIEHQTSDTVSIMFAHQSTFAWTILCNSILGAGLNITGSWAIDTEMASRTLALAGAALESSVTVSCKPANRSGFGDYKQVKAAIEKKIEEEVAELYGLGFRGADLLTACFGKAVGEFGKYERVEKASGDEVTVAELLEMTRESAFNALLKGFKGDDFTKFYIGWLELYGFTESDFDDAAKFSRVGLSINVADLFARDIFIKNGNKQSLADFVYRNEKKRNLGETADASLIDKVHKAMWLYKGSNRRALLDFIGKVANTPDSSFWRVLTSLNELLPKGMDDQKQVAGLLENKDNLIRESGQSRETTEQQQGLFS
jgi:intein/homing endonuclease